MALSRKDANHYEIRRELCYVTEVQDVSQFEGLGCDLIAKHCKGGYPVFVEIKLPRSRNRISGSEAEMQSRWPANYCVVTTVAEALCAVGYEG